MSSTSKERALTPREGVPIGVMPLVAVAVLLLKQLWVPVEQWVAPSPTLVLGSLGTSLLLVAPLARLRGRAFLLGFLVVDQLFSALVLGDLVFLRTNGTMLSLAMGSTLMELRSLSSLLKVVSSILHAYDSPLWADLFLLVPLLALPARLLPSSGMPRCRWVALAGLTLIAGELGADPFWRTGSWRSPAAASRIGVGGYHVLNTSARLGRRLQNELGLAKLDEQELAAWARLHQPMQHQAPGGQPPNVVLVQFESLQGFVLGLKVRGQEVTPNLTRLAAGGVSFDHAYSQVGLGNTSDAELLSLCSLYPARTEVALHVVGSDRLRCLPTLAREAGYATLAMHGNDLRIYNRAEAYPSMGFATALGLQQLGPGPTVGLGLADTALFERAAEAMTQQSQPFLAHLVTLSSHRPYEGVPESLDLGEFRGTNVGLYLNAVHYADAALGSWLSAMRRSGLLERTVVVVYGDHSGVGSDESGVRALTGLPLASALERARFEHQVPLIFSGPGLGPPRVEHGAAGQVDIAPTLARLLGLQGERLFLGRDLLGGSPGRVVFYGDSALDDRHFYLATIEQAPACLELASGAQLPSESCAGLVNYARRELSNNEVVLRHDLVRTLAHVARDPHGVMAGLNAQALRD